MGDPVPTVMAEDYVCRQCALSYSEVSVQRAIDVVGSVAELVSDAVAQIPDQYWNRRPNAGGWSIAEYVCHVRDVYITYTIRLHRSRTEDRPTIEPMLNDLRAQRFRYNDCDVRAVLREIEAAAAGFCEEASQLRPEDWSRTVSRLPGEQRTALWLARQAMHEGVHHVHDIRRAGRSVATASATDVASDLPPGS